MADFKYVINTELKLAPSAINNLLQDVRRVDNEIKDIFDKHHSIKVQIDESGLTGLSTKIKNAIANAQDTKVYIDVDVKPTSMADIMTKVRTIKTQIETELAQADNQRIQIRVTPFIAESDMAEVRRQLSSLDNDRIVRIDVDYDDDSLNRMNQRLRQATSVSMRDGLRPVGSRGQQSNLNDALTDARINRMNAEATERMARVQRMRDNVGNVSFKVKTGTTLGRIASVNQEIKKNQELAKSYKDMDRAISNLEEKQRKNKSGRYRNDEGKMVDIAPELNRLKQQRQEYQNVLADIARLENNRRDLTRQLETQVPRFKASSLPKNHPLAEANRQRREDEKARAREQKDNDARNYRTKVGTQGKSYNDPEAVLKDASATTKQQTEANKQLERSMRQIAMIQGRTVHNSFQTVSRDLEGNIVRTRGAAIEFDRFGQRVIRNSDSMVERMRTIGTNLFFYNGMTEGFYAIANGIQESVKAMAEFEQQMIRIENLSQDFSDFTKSGYNTSDLGNVFGVKTEYATRKGMESYSATDVSRSVFDIATERGVDASSMVMPVFQNVMRKNDVAQNLAQTDQITRQIMDFASVAYGPELNADNLQKVTSDILTVYENTKTNQETGQKRKPQEQINYMGQMLDYFARIEQTTLKSELVTDVVGELAPDALNKGVDPKMLAALTGAYTLKDDDASSDYTSRAIRTLFNGLANPNNKKTKRALAEMGIDPSQGVDGNMTVSEIIGAMSDEMQRNPDKYGEGSKSLEGIANLLSSTSGSGSGSKEMQGRITKLLQAIGDDQYQALISPDSMNTVGDATNMAERNQQSLTVQMGKTVANLKEMVTLFGELGAMDAFKGIIGSINMLLEALNGALRGLSDIGNGLESIGAPNVVNGVVQLAGAFAMLKMGKGMFNMFAPRDLKGRVNQGLGNMARGRGFSEGATGLANAAGTVMGGATMFYGMKGASSNLATGRTYVNSQRVNMSDNTVGRMRRDRTNFRITRNPRVVQTNSGVANGIGMVIGETLGWLLGGKTARNGENNRASRARTGTRNAVSSTIANTVGKFNWKGLIGNLTKFGWLLGRLSLVGAGLSLGYLGLKQLVAEIAGKANKEKAENLSKYQSYAIGNDEQKKATNQLMDSYASLSAQYEKGELNNVGKATLDQVRKDLDDRGIKTKLGTAQGEAPAVDGNVATGSTYTMNSEGAKKRTAKLTYFVDGKEKEIDARNATDLAFAKSIVKDDGFSQQALIEQSWDKAVDGLGDYEDKIKSVNDLVEEHSKLMTSIQIASKHNSINFLGAENSTGYIQGEIFNVQRYLNESSATYKSVQNTRDLVNSGISNLTPQRDEYREFAIADIAEKEEVSKSKATELLKNREVELKAAIESGEADTYIENKDGAEGNFYKQTILLESLSDKQKELDETESDLTLTHLEQQQALKQLRIQYGIAATGVNVYQAQLSKLQTVTGHQSALVNMTDDDNTKLSRSLDLMKMQGAELNGQYAMLQSINSSMSDIKANNPDMDFSTQGLYNPQTEMSEAQSIYKGLLEQSLEVQGSIDTSTQSLYEQRKNIEDLVLNSDKYAAMWERVQSRIEAVKAIAKEIVEIRADSSALPQIASARQAITGKNQNEYIKTQRESLRDRAMDNYAQAVTALKDFGGDAKKLQEAYDEINKSMESEFDKAFISPLQSLIENQFTDAGDLIKGGASDFSSAVDRFEGIATSMNQATQAIDQSWQSAVSTGEGAQSVAGYDPTLNKSINVKSASYEEKLAAYIEQNFGYRQGSKEFSQMKRQMELSMTKTEITKEVDKNTVSGNNGAVSAYAKQIDEYFSNTGRKKLVGYGNQFVQAGTKYGIDPRFIAAIATQETGGTSGIIDAANNVGNIKAFGDPNKSDGNWDGSGVNWHGYEYRKYDSMQDGINDLARLLNDVYISQGLTTIPQINSKYAEDQNWKVGVSSIYSRLTGISQSQLLGNTAVTSGSAVSSGGSSSSGGGSSTYTVKKGDTLSGIGSKYGISWQKIQSANNGISPTKLQVGQKLKIPTGGSSSSSSSSGGGGVQGASSKTQWVAQHYTSGDWYYSSLFGDGRNHKGVDFSKPGSADLGEPIYSFLGGTVARSGYQAGGAGNYIVIKQDDGSEQKYMHMQYATSLKNGTKVSAGDVLGKVGNTGGSSGAHLHYGMFDKNGNAIDPKKFVDQWRKGEGIGSSTSSGSSTAQKDYEKALKEAMKEAQESYMEGLKQQLEIDKTRYKDMRTEYFYNRDLDMGVGNIRDQLGTSARTSYFDNTSSQLENVYSERFDNASRLREYSTKRADLIKQANNAAKKQDKTGYDFAKEQLKATESLIKTLNDNNKKLAEWQKTLEKQLQRDPRLNSGYAQDYIAGGYTSVRKMDVGSVNYYRKVAEVNQMNTDYMTTDKKVATMQEFWNNSGQETNQLGYMKRYSTQQDINLLFTKMSKINTLMNRFAEGSQDWLVTLEDAVAVQEELKQLEETRLQNAQSMFTLTGKGIDGYIQQRAHVQSDEYNQAKSNVKTAVKKFKSDEMNDAYRTVVGKGNYTKAQAEKIEDVIKNQFGVSASIKQKNKKDKGSYYLETQGRLTKSQANYIAKELKDNKSLPVGYATNKKVSDGGAMNRQEELANLGIIADLQNQLTESMNDYRNSVVGAFKAGAMSLSEYIKRMNDLRDVQVEARENALNMVDSITGTFQSSLASALQGGMQGNLDSTQGFVDSIKEGLSSSISSQLSTVLMNNTGLKDTMNGLMSSIVTAATSGSPDKIANMFNSNDFGSKIDDALAPFLPLIEQIVSSTDGIFTTLKDQVFNAPDGFKINDALYEVAKGKDYEGIKNWLPKDKNEAGSTVKNNSSNKPIKTPTQKDKVDGVPDYVTNPTTGAIKQTGDYEYTSETGVTKAPDTSNNLAKPDVKADKLQDYKKKEEAKKSSSSSSSKSSTTTYTIKKGDTLGELAAKYLGSSSKWTQIRDLNKGINPNNLQIGQKIKIPASGSSSSSKSSSSSSKTKTVKSSLNMRSKPSYNGSVIKVLSKGSKVEYLGMESGWAKVKQSGKTGYVGKNYIYHTGGIAGQMNFQSPNGLKSDEISAILRKGETTLTSQQVNALAGIGSSTSGGNGGDINVNIEVNVDGNGGFDQKGIEATVDTAVSKAMKAFAVESRRQNLTFRGTSY